jgi:hypothetical protein
MREIRIDPQRWHWKYQGSVNMKGGGDQRAGAGWSVGVGATVGGWWDRSKKVDKEEKT